MPQCKTFTSGLDFIERNHNEDLWFLQIEAFDPHEPFYTQNEYKNYILITTMVKIWIGPIMERTNMERPLPDMSAMNTPHL